MEAIMQEHRTRDRNTVITIIILLAITTLLLATTQSEAQDVVHTGKDTYNIPDIVADAPLSIALNPGHASTSFVRAGNGSDVVVLWSDGVEDCRLPAIVAVRETVSHRILFMINMDLCLGLAVTLPEGEYFVDVIGREIGVVNGQIDGPVTEVLIGIDLRPASLAGFPWPMP